jgi:hypothetical protein
MRQVLKLHPDSRCAAASGVEAEVSVPRSGNLVLQYFVTGKLSELRMPPVSTPNRSDQLWQHTCFEAFLRAPPAAGYYELNFSPSMQWSAYRFSGYRNDMTVASEIDAPRFEVRSDAGRYRMQASLDLNRLPNLPSKGTWHLGLSAVIEEASGGKSYWALAHPPGKPDFHHSDCFVITLPTTDRS